MEIFFFCFFLDFLSTTRTHVEILELHCAKILHKCVAAKDETTTPPSLFFVCLW